MLRRIFKISVIAAAAILCSGKQSFAQSGEYGSFSPYSIFGIGDLSQQGSAYNRSMGGVGVASRNVRFLNVLNPAAITARDSLACMVDFSIQNNNTIFSQGKMTSANNNTNIGTMAISFPIWNKLSAMVGISPYSSTGYSYASHETDPAVIAANGNISYACTGLGSLYKLYMGAGMAFTKRFSVGAEVDYIFGNLEKISVQSFEKSGNNNVQDTYNMHLGAFTGKFGVQYEQPVNTKLKLGVGATWKMAGNLGGTVEYTHLAVGNATSMDIGSDTLNVRNVSLAGEFALGFSVNYDDRFRAGLDFALSDWTGTRMDSAMGFANAAAKQAFSSALRYSTRLGMEFTPNRNDIRYYRNRITYRAGAYYNNDYFKVAGHDVRSVGITVGATLPVFRWYNGVSVALDLGQRGTGANGLVRENYFKICIGVNLFDIWFQQPRYD